MQQHYDPEFPIDDLVEHPDNPRRGDESVIEASMAAHGFYGAVLVQASTRRIIAGNHRTRVARRRGDSTIPVLLIDVDDDRARRILLVDNRSNDVATYDDRELARLLADLDGDLAGTGFDDTDLTALLASFEPEAGPEVDAPIPEAAPAITMPGDIWELGRHRLICGDCRDPAVVARILDGAVVNLAITSPPYADRRPYDASSGFLPIRPDEFVDWFEPVAANVAAHLAADGSWFVNIKAGSNGLDIETYVLDLVLAHCRRWGWHWATEYCWERVGVPLQPARRFKNQFEPVYQFTRGEWKFRPDAVRHASDNVPQAIGTGAGDTNWAKAQGLAGPSLSGRQGQHWRTRDHQGIAFSSIEAQGTPGHPWFKDRTEPGLAYPGNRLPTFSGSHEATGHNAAYPVGLPAWFARAYTDLDDVIFDPFTGSGSTLLAAHQTGRVGYGIELSPGYVDICCLRFQRATGIMPRRCDQDIDFTSTEHVANATSVAAMHTTPVEPEPVEPDEPVTPDDE